MSDELRFPTSLGTSSADEIRLLGEDLTALMGNVGFGELAFWLVTLRRPTPQETRVFEAVLVALADHGFTPTAIAARLTYLSAPDSLQGAMAAGLLGGGSRFLGVTEDCGQYLDAVLAAASEIPADDAGFDLLALEAGTSLREEIGETLGFDDLAALVSDAFARQYAVALEDAPLSALEEQAVAALAQRDSRAWTATRSGG